MEELKYFVVIEVSPWYEGKGYKYSTIVDNQKHYYIWSADELKHEMMEGFYEDGIEDADGVNCTATYYNLGDDPALADPVEIVECWIYPEDYE